MDEFQKTPANVSDMNEASENGWLLVTVYVGQLERHGEYYNGPVAIWCRPKEPTGPTDVDGGK